MTLDSIWNGACPKHGVEMRAVPGSGLPNYAVPLHRCPLCCAEFRAAVAKAKACFKHSGRPFLKQRVLPPVIMSERWP